MLKRFYPRISYSHLPRKCYQQKVSFILIQRSSFMLLLFIAMRIACVLIIALWCHKNTSSCYMDEIEALILVAFDTILGEKIDSKYDELKIWIEYRVKSDFTRDMFYQIDQILETLQHFGTKLLTCFLKVLLQKQCCCMSIFYTFHTVPIHLDCVYWTSR